MRDRILEYFRLTPYRKADVSKLKDDLNIQTSKEFTALIKELNRLVEEAILIEGKNHEYTLIENTNFLTGILHLKRRGYGFVLPDHPNLEDVYIPSNALREAMNLDHVLVRVIKKGNRFRSEGEIVRILKHNRTHLVGTVVLGKKNITLLVDDTTIKQEVFIAKNNLLGARDGDKVYASILNYAKKGRIECAVDRILGHQNDSGVDVLAKLFEYDIDPFFPEEVLAQAKEIKLSIDDENRKDLRNLPFVTIDGIDAKDFDDAVYVTREKQNNYRLYVSIADVSHYVTEGSLLDEEAFRRGTSIYLADRVVPMLPEVLSNDLCSLKPMEDRLCITCEMLIKQDGSLKQYDLYPSIIKSSARLTYHNVNLLYEGEDLIQNKDITKMLFDLRNLASLLKKRRQSMGSLDFVTQEAKFILNEDGKVKDIQLREHGIAESVIEECMLQANKVVAEHFHWMEVPFIYRVHDLPDEAKLRKLVDLSAAFGYKVKGTHEVSRHELKQLLKRVKNTPHEQVINMLVLRSMQKAIYSHINIGHYGLAFPYYTHFTSPIRRYPDLIVHRLIRQYIFKSDLSEKTLSHVKQLIEGIASYSSKTERNAVNLERDVAAMKMAEYMSSHIGEEFEGYISSITSFGIYVSLPNTIEGLVHISNLQDDYYHYDEHFMMLVGDRTRKTYRIGNKVIVKVISVNILDGEIDFQLLSGGDVFENNRTK